MTESLVVTKRSLIIAGESSALPGSIDVLLNDHRVWSTTPPAPAPDGRIHLRWPAALVPYLKGRATVSVRDSATEAVVAEADVQIGGSSAPIEVTNAQGRWLAVNKWQRMGASLEGDSSGMTERLISRAKVLADQLHDLGYVVSITSGTLLGAVRRANLLPHDDDIDLSILFEQSHPSDLSLESFRLEDRLHALGYVVVRHSTAHLQVMFLFDTGETDHYIDIFSAFYRNEDFCQPFHVRTPVPRSSLVPVKTMEIAGVPFPAPAVPADWLAACYGPHWETPDPSFHFVTPLATRRRFENWFGSQNMNRVYWETEYARVDERLRADGDASHLRALSRALPRSVPVVDLGCGTAINAEVIAEHGHDVIGVDYSYRALALARAATDSSFDLRYLNLYDRRRLLEFGAELVKSGRPWHFNLQHVLEGLTKEGRGNVFLFLRLVLTERAHAFATFDTNFSTRHYRGDKPETWHLPLTWLREEAGKHRLAVDVVTTGSRRTKNGRRKTATVTLSLDSYSASPGD